MNTRGPVVYAGVNKGTHKAVYAYKGGCLLYTSDAADE